MKRVCIVQPVMKGYRVAFFQLLAEALESAGIELTVQYGRPWPVEALRGDNVTLPPPLGHESANLRLLGHRLLLQPAVRPWWGADLVVLEHANKHLHNHLLALLRHRCFGRLAYWGHGRNRQGDVDSLGERIKRHSLHGADWWFAYTAGAAAYVAGQGFPAERITTVENAVDTRVLRSAVAGLSAAAREAALARRGWSSEHVVGVYCGSLYPYKHLDVLVDAGRQIQQALPAFRLLVIGGGPQAAWMAEQAALHAGWLRYEGPLFGAEKAEGLAMAHVFMNPGLVGLGILDAFSAGLPLLTTDVPVHSPEIEYLEAGVNGLMSAPGVEAYAVDVLALLADRARLGRLAAGARATSERYSVETMARNFAQGVVACLTK